MWALVGGGDVGQSRGNAELLRWWSRGEGLPGRFLFKYLHAVCRLDTTFCLLEKVSPRLPGRASQQPAAVAVRLVLPGALGGSVLSWGPVLLVSFCPGL